MSISIEKHGDLCNNGWLQLLETSVGQQEEVLAYIEKKKKKRGMVCDHLTFSLTTHQVSFMLSIYILIPLKFCLQQQNPFRW